MKCEQCNSRMRCHNTRENGQGNERRRYYDCSCGAKLTTVEMSADALAELMAFKKTVQTLKDVLR